MALPGRDPQYTALLERVELALTDCAAIDEETSLADVAAKLPTLGVDLSGPMQTIFEHLPLCRLIAKHADRLDGMPSTPLKNLLDAAKGIANAAQRVRTLPQTASESEIRAHAQKQVTAIQNDAPGWFTPLLAALTYVNKDGTDTAALREELEAEAAQIEKQRAEVEQQMGDLKELVKQAHAALEAAKEAAIQQGVTKQGQEFRDAKVTYGREAKWWALGALACGILILGFAAHAIGWSDGPPLRKESWTAAANLSHFGARILVVTVVSFVMVVCVRNYRGAKHNEVMNAHRAQALATFRQFREGAEEKVAEAVTLHAAEAVFSVQVSGFTEGESVGSTHVAELLAALKGKE